MKRGDNVITWHRSECYLNQTVLSYNIWQNNLRKLKTGIYCKLQIQLESDQSVVSVGYLRIASDDVRVETVSKNSVPSSSTSERKQLIIYITFINVSESE